MLKARKKSISVLLVLTMLVTMLFAFAGPAMAATSNYALFVPNVQNVNGATLGTVRVVETTDTVGSVRVGDQITITLPAGVSYAVAPTAATLNAYIQTPGLSGQNTLDRDGVDGIFGNADDDIVFVAGSTKSLTVRIAGFTGPGTAPGTTNPRAAIDFVFTGGSAVNLSGASGDLMLNIAAPGTGFSEGNVLFGRAVTAGTTATALTAPTRARGSNNVAAGLIRLTENVAGALRGHDLGADGLLGTADDVVPGPGVDGIWNTADDVVAQGTNSISITVPSGITISAAAIVTTAGGWLPGDVVVGPIDIDTQGRSRVRLTVVNDSIIDTDGAGPDGTGPGMVDIQLNYNISDTAELGDIVVSISGTNQGITATTLTNAKVGDFGVTVSVENPKDVYAGRVGASIGTIKVKEGLAGSLIPNRTITLELPAGMSWEAIPVATIVSGATLTVATPAAVVANSDERKLSYTIGAAASTAPVTIEFRQGSVNVDVENAEGDIQVTVGGSAGLSGTAVIGKVVKPVTVTADATEVKVGAQSQAVGDITITEVAAGALMANPNGVQGQITVTPPAGVSFAGTPTVEVTDGNLKLDTTGISTAGGVLTIPLRTGSTTASTVKISNIKLTLDRTVPEGALNVRIGGRAVNQDLTSPQPFMTGTNVARVKVADVVTPAPQVPGEVVTTATFTIGSTTYTVGDTEQTMDVAPFMENGRAYLPIRYAAYAVGVSEDNIMWDGATSTATLIKGDRVVQLTINSNKMLINGATITMDVPAKMVSGRTMLPVRWVGNALGCQVDWDDATQTVTVTQ